jgi:thymidylate synthase
MNNLDVRYQALLQDILDNGVTKSDRTGTGTISIFGRQICHKMSEGFPLLTTKKMPFKTITTELLWFLRGDTNIKYLVDNDCHIWTGDAYKAYREARPLDRDAYTIEEFEEQIKTNSDFALRYGELGPIYGKQWRSWIKYTKGDYVMEEQGHIHYTDSIDQIQNLINDLKTNPDSRRLMVNAWNVGELDQMVLPPCHYGFQVYTRELSWEERVQWVLKHTDVELENLYIVEEIAKNSTPKRAISLMWNQRSCDLFLGIPFNIASYGLLLEIIAKEVNMIPDELIGNLGDVHLYSNHIEQAKEQIGRELTHEERTELLKQAMGEENYNKAVDELMPFGGGLTEYYDSYKIPYTTREPYKLPRLKFSPCPITGIDMEYQSIAQFQIENYESHPVIKAPLSN